MKKLFESVLKNIAYDTQQADAIDISATCYKDLVQFQKYLESLSVSNESNWVSKDYDVWVKGCSDYTRKMMAKHQNFHADYEFWKHIYMLLTNIIYSPNLKTRYVTHDSTAFERNEALKYEIRYLVQSHKI